MFQRCDWVSNTPASARPSTIPQSLSRCREREFWPELQNHFPLYEEFWRLHVFRLRGPDGYIRGDIDGRLEIMAQEHYKCFISLHKALRSLGDETHPEQTFSNAPERRQPSQSGGD